MFYTNTKVFISKIFCCTFVLYCSVLIDAYYDKAKLNYPLLNIDRYFSQNVSSADKELSSDEESSSDEDDSGKNNQNDLKVVKKGSIRISSISEVQLGEIPHHVFIYTLFDKKKKLYRAFCAGNIITTTRVLTSAHCFLTNRKRLKVPLHEIEVVAGILSTLTPKPITKNEQQWRKIKKIYSQRFFRFPAYNNAVLEMTQLFTFNDIVNKIPYASLNQDFDGVCRGATIKPGVCWADKKNLFAEDLQMLTKRECEGLLLRSAYLYYCTAYKIRYINSDIEGGGLICYETNDPQEKNDSKGVLVGITSAINIGLPTLHHKVSIFHKWITDCGSTVMVSKLLVLFLYVFLLNIQL